MRSCACLQDPQVNLYQKSKGGAKWISQDWPLVRAPALRRRRLPAGTPPPRVANSSLPAASCHPCHMTRPPSLLPPSPPPSKAPPALRPPSYLIDAATNATSSILTVPLPRRGAVATIAASAADSLGASPWPRSGLPTLPLKRLGRAQRLRAHPVGPCSSTGSATAVGAPPSRTCVLSVCLSAVSAKSFCTGFQC